MLKDELAHWNDKGWGWGWESVTDNCTETCKRYRMRYMVENKYRKLFEVSKFSGIPAVIDPFDLSGKPVTYRSAISEIEELNARRPFIEDAIDRKTAELDIPKSRYKQSVFAEQLDVDYHGASEISAIEDMLFSKATPPKWIDTMKYIIIEGGNRQTRTLMISSILYRLVIYNANRLSPGSEMRWSAIRKDWVELLTDIEEDRREFVDFHKMNTEDSVIGTSTLCLQEIKDTTLLTPAVIDVLDSVLSRRIDKIGGGINISSLSPSISRGLNYGNIIGQILKTDRIANNPTSVCMKIRLKQARDTL